MVQRGIDVLYDKSRDSEPRIDKIKNFPQYEIKQEVLKSIIDSLGIKFARNKIHVQPPGHVFPIHIDNLFGSYRIQHIDASIEEVRAFSKSPKKFHRFFIMLDRCYLGQTLILDNKVFHDWNKGDVFFMDWEKTLHGSANASYWDRPMLILTGLESDKTIDILNGNNSSISIEY